MEFPIFVSVLLNTACECYCMCISHLLTLVMFILTSCSLLFSLPALASHQEESLRLRKLAVSDTVSASNTPSAFASQPQASSFPPMVYLVVAIIIGLILGKFILQKLPPRSVSVFCYRMESQECLCQPTRCMEFISLMQG